MIWSFFLLVINVPVYAGLPDFTQMVKQYGGAVVNISTTKKAPEVPRQLDRNALPEGVSPQMEELFKHFFQQPGGMKQPKSLGSGFNISKEQLC